MLLDVEIDQWSSYPMRDGSACHRIDDCDPDQIAGNTERMAEQREGGSAGETPQNHNEGAEGYHGTKQAGAERQGVGDEQLDILSDALVGVVGAIGRKLHAVWRGIFQPRAKQTIGHPLTPSNLETLAQIELVDGEQNE